MEGLKKRTVVRNRRIVAKPAPDFPNLGFAQGLFARLADVRAALRPLPAAAAMSPESETRVTMTMDADAVQTGTESMPAARAPREAGGTLLLLFL
ncbi:hypothetical protein [Acidovorax sp. RAC01]|uniref:hypothetical protein n=1 Tax=Acidovorax sp. RAC01 TaxID=1842533 RepID=UPI0012EAC59E|nr:hypothetical protein [Acidovorax sp. RAC01]